MTPLTGRLLIGMAALATVAAGCTGTSGPSSASSTPAGSGSTTTSPLTPAPTTTSVPASSTPAPSPTTLTGFALTRMATSVFPEAIGQLGVGVAVRVGRHDGYDRVVYEFAGSGLPSYAVRYVTTPIGDPSGERVQVAGDAYLEVVVAGVGYPENGEVAPARVPASDLAGTVIAEAGRIYGGFEAMAQTFIGVTGQPRPFRVLTLTEPSRLVVDIATG